MILSPMMLELGVMASVAAATASYMIFFTALSSLAQFAILGLVIWDYGALFAVVGFICSLIGQIGLDALVTRFQKRSYIVWCVVFIIAASTILLGVTGTLNLLKSIENNAYLGFNNYCPK